MDDSELHKRLCGLIPGQWSALLVDVCVERHLLRDGSRAEAAADLVQWASTQGRRDALVAAFAPSSVTTPASWQAHQLAAAREVPVIGFKVQGTPIIDIHQVFVPLSLLRGRGFGIDGDFDAWSALTGLTDLTDLGSAQRGLVIVGRPGSGKTTLLQHIYCQVAEGRRKELEGLTPVFLPARRVPAGFQGKERGLAELVELVAAAEGYSGAGRALCQEGARLLVLVDGLDEIGHDATRANFSAWLSRETRHWPDCCFVVSCRPPAFERDQAALTQRLQPLTVCPFGDPDIEAYVRGWWTAVQRVEGDRHFTPEVATERATRLLDQLLRGGASHAAVRLLQLAANPLTLSILCLVDFRVRGRLPRTRRKLYEECLGVLLEGRPQARGKGALGLDAGQAELLLQPLAWRMQQAAGDDPYIRDQPPSPKALPQEEVVAVLSESARELPELARIGGEELVERLVDECGVLARPDEGELSFTHLTFQEYLAALHARERGLVQELVEVAHQPAWHEVVRLAGSLAGLGERLLQGLLGRKELNTELVREVARELERTPGPWLREMAADNPLAAELLGERPAVVVTPEVSWEPTTRPLERPEDIEGWTVIRRVLPVVDMAMVWVPPGVFWMGATKQKGHPAYDSSAKPSQGPSRRVRISRGFWLGEHPVTNTQWRVFCDTTGKEVPPTWRDEALAGPALPVTGVSWEDAESFCGWLDPQLSGLRARLPTEAEWEWAARGPEGRPFPWGTSAPDPSRAVVGGTRLAPVGGRPAGAGPFGAQDQSGQVWEWVEDGWRDYLLAKGDCYDPCYHGDAGAARVLRGGSWLGRSRFLRSAFRLGDIPKSRATSVGFRLCVSVPPSTIGR